MESPKVGLETCLHEVARGKVERLARARHQLQWGGVEAWCGSGLFWLRLWRCCSVAEASEVVVDAGAEDAMAA